MISELKMAWLQLGVSVKEMILVSCLQPKDLITKAYPNYTKSDKVEGLVVASEGPKLICCEEKVVVVFCHPPEDQEAEEFDCWALCWFIHVTEEGEEAGLFNGLTGGGDNIAEATEVAELVPNNMSESTEMEDSENNSPPKNAQLLECCTASRSVAINNDDAMVLVTAMLLPGEMMGVWPG